MAMREYRKGNWTVEETMILIEAKKKDDERRKFNRSKQTLQIATPTGSGSGSKPTTELRWKWVEEYCWGKGCFRSQNQCNDKWDNLMRDYKKVRDYQKNLPGTEPEPEPKPIPESNKSYWNMDKVERKDKGLPTNMLPQIYQALFDVVEGSVGAAASASASASGSAGSTPTPTPTSTMGHFLVPSSVVEMQQTSPLSVASLQLSSPPSSVVASPRLPPLLLSPPPLSFLSPQQLPHHPSTTAALEHERSEQYSHDPESSPAKRRRKEEGIAAAAAAAAATHTEPEPPATTTATATTTTLEEVNTAIGRSGRMISDAIQASEERQERRHREMINIQESRLRVQESELEINRQGFITLTDAINRLATSIFTWANSHKNQQGPS